MTGRYERELEYKVNRMVRKEKVKMKEYEIKEVSNGSTAKSLWNYIKRKACWSTSLTPIILRVGESDYTYSPVKMASELNRFFVDPVNTICNNLLPCNEDPTSILKNLMNKWNNLNRVPTF